MKRKRTFTTPACCLLLALNMPFGNLFGQRTQFDPEAARSAIAEIEAVSPAEERMVLIYSVTNAFSHPSVPHGKKVLELLGDKTGAYQAIVSDDAAHFEKESLSGFDAVVFNNTSGSTLLGMPKRDFENLAVEEQTALREREARYKENLMEYIRGGGGFVGIHAASDTYKDWPEYVEMIGGAFAGHPWNRSSEVVIDVVEPEHPLVAGIFDSNSFPLQEEIYTHRDNEGQFIGAENKRLLLKLNLEKSPEKNFKGEMVPLVWIKEIGEGRLFYTAIGDNRHLYHTKPVLEHYLRGIQYAVGDLPADATPKQ